MAIPGEVGQHGIACKVQGELAAPGGALQEFLFTEDNSGVCMSERQSAFGPGRYRWVVVALLFVAMVINYIDRQMIGVLKPGYLQPEFGWSETDYANIVTWFQAAYALSYLFFGR